MKRNAEIRPCVFALVAVLLITAPVRSTLGQETARDKSLPEDQAVTNPITEVAQQETLEPEPETIHRDEVVVFGQDVHLGKNEVCREMVVIGGNVTIEGTVQRDVVVIFGSSKVKGTVRGDLVTILGSCELDGKVHGSFVSILGSPVLKARALVEREAVAIGGKLLLDPGAIIRGRREEIALGESFQWLGDWFRGGFLKARPLPPSLVWGWFVAGAFLMIYVLMAMLFPRPLKACVNSLDDAPVAAFFVGLLSYVLFFPVLLLLCVTVVGPPLLMLSFVVALFFGKAAIYQFTGQQFARQLNLTGLQAPLIALLIGYVILLLLYTVPVIGFLALGVGSIWGVGATVMATFANFRRERKPAPAYALPTSVVAGNPGVGAPPPMEGMVTAPAAGAAEFTHFERAGFWIRTFATIIDLLLIGVASLFLGHGLSFPFLLVIYFVAMWTWKGTTVGGIVFGLKIVRLDGRSIDFAVALVRSLFSIISAFFFFIGFFWAGWDKEKQSWHDKIAGTVIVTVPKGISLV